MSSILKQKRIALGLSQQGLSNKSSINLRTLQDYEQGRKSLRLASSDIVYKLSIVLGCNMEELIIETNDIDNAKEKAAHRATLYSTSLSSPSLIGQVNITIDELVPCLIDTLTGEKLETVVFKIESKAYLTKYNQKTGWKINWGKLPDNVEIYALATSFDNQIQGLIALKNDVTSNAVYIHWACTAPHNNIHEHGSQKYSGVGGHLFAIAADKSIEYGHMGYVYGFANSRETLEHYTKKLGAISFAALHPYQFIIDEENAKSLMEVYNYEWNSPS